MAIMVGLSYLIINDSHLEYSQQVTSSSKMTMMRVNPELEDICALKFWKIKLQLFLIVCYIIINNR